MTAPIPHPDLPIKPQGPDADLLDDLTVAELRIANTKLKADCVDAVTTPTAHRWDAMALALWLWHKRLDPQADLTLWQTLTAAQLHLHAGAIEVDQAGADVDQAPGAEDDADDPAQVIGSDPTQAAP